MIKCSRGSYFVHKWVMNQRHSIRTMIPRAFFYSRLKERQKVIIEPTIYNISTPPGKSGIAVIRVSGEQATEVLQRMTNKKLANFKPRLLVRCDINQFDTPSIIIDSGLAVYFQAPSSFTGEDTVELHVHGSIAVIQAILKSLSKIPNYRLSEPGEFTKRYSYDDPSMFTYLCKICDVVRAFYNGKMDLTEIEGLGDLIHSETESQRILALSQMRGSLKTMYERWRNGLIKSLANIEAFIDFSEDDNIEANVLSTVSSLVHQLIMEMNTHLNDSHKGEILRNGVNIAIIGPPNVGKSTLLNFLAQRKAAIVSPMPGTTRDMIQVSVNLGGYQVNFIDTAGLRNPTAIIDPIEKEGIELSICQSQEANIVILVLDKSSAREFITVTPHFNALVEKRPHSGSMVILYNKVDLEKEQEEEEEPLVLSELAQALKNEYKDRLSPFAVYPVSTLTNIGMDEFIEALRDMVAEQFDRGATTSAQPVITKERHRRHLLDCMNHLKDFLSSLSRDIVLAAEDLREASDGLGRITGKINTDDILDVLFHDFCIGK